MFGMVRNAIQTAQTAVESIVNHTSQEVTKATTDIAGEVTDYFNLDNLSLKGLGKGAWDGLKTVLSGGGGLGHVVDGALDGLGLPDWVGNFAGAAVNFATMNHGGAAELLLKGGGMLAGEAGLDGLEGFLSTAGDITGMAMRIGTQVAMTVATGGAGAAGVLGQLGANAGKLGQVGQFLGKGLEMAGGMEGILNIAGAFKGGDVAGVGSALFDVFGGNFGAIGDLLGGLGGSGIGEALGGLLGESGGLLGNVLQQFGGDLLSQLPVGEILGQLGLGSDGLSGLAGPIVEIGKELVGMVGESVDLPGTALFASEAGKELVAVLADLLSEQVSGTLNDLAVTSEAVIDAAAQTTAGLIDVAANDAEVARELIELLLQMSTMGTSAPVSDLVGAHIHC